MHFDMFSFVPRLGCQWQFIKLSASFTPRRIVLAENLDKSLAVCRLDEMNHFMDDLILQQVLGFRHELRVQPDMRSGMIAASPFCLHPLEEISFDFDV